MTELNTKLLVRLLATEEKAISSEGNFKLLNETEEMKSEAVDAAISSGIQLNNWLIGDLSNHISSASYLEKLEKEAKLTAPEMVFGDNEILFYHPKSGFLLQFSALQALKCTHFNDKSMKQLKVSIATNQKSTSANGDEVKELDIPYDWTYTNDYKGTINKIGREEGSNEKFVANGAIEIQETTERIDYEKLKQKEPILWFKELDLFEDELHDHGISIMSVKVRVMPSGFYCLQRFWLRLDNVVMRLYETRIHHIFNTNYLIREFTAKEETFDNLFAQGHPTQMANYVDVNTFQHLLSVKETLYEKILL